MNNFIVASVAIDDSLLILHSLVLTNNGTMSVSIGLAGLKQGCCFALLNHNIYITADSTPACGH